MSNGPTEMDWGVFPGIIPFIPGADVNQIAWFTRQVSNMGYTTLALDAVNTLAHENYRNLPDAISTVLHAGAKHVMVYGPWPLHMPKKHVRTQHVSYIPSAHHMDLTDRPRRFWRKPTEANERQKWKRLPNYRRIPLGRVRHQNDIQICSCPPCRAAVKEETDPRSIWRFGHLLHAGERWMKRVKKKNSIREVSSPSSENVTLRYQGPSYMVYRRCLHLPQGVHWESDENIVESFVFLDHGMKIQFPDGVRVPSYRIRWTSREEGHEWMEGFPELEEF